MIKIQAIIDQFSQLNAVQAIVLGGSQASGLADSNSDIDLYMYVNERIDTHVRKSILTPYCTHLEIANTYWEEEDDVILIDGTVLEIIYRDIKSFVHGLNRVAYEHIPSNAYTTCQWYSLIYSRVLYEVNHIYSKIQKRYQFSYPDRLTERIIDHSIPLLTGAIPSYDTQIIKAFHRGDYVSVNHRITEFLATYFDILFAVNKMLHPGEKRMIEQLKKGTNLPKQYEELIYQLINYQNQTQTIENILNKIIFHLKELLSQLK